MGYYLCHKCAVQDQPFMTPGADAIDLSGTVSRFASFMDQLLSQAKHDRASGYHAIGRDPSIAAYQDWQVNSALAGGVEVDDFGWYATISFYLWQGAGMVYEMGMPMGNDRTVKLSWRAVDPCIRVNPVSSGIHISTADCACCMGRIVV